MTQMTADQQNRYDDLVSRYVDLDDKEKAELDGLVKTVKEAKAIEDIQKKLKAASLPSSKARVSMLGSLMLAMTTRRPTSFASWPRQRVNSPTRPNSAKCPKTSSAVRLPSRMMPQSKLPRRMPKPLLPNLQHSTPKPSKK